MVVNHVEANPQPQVVGGVNEPVQRVRPTVGLVDGEQAHPVVTPAAASWERRQRHQFDDVDAQVDQVGQPFDGRIQGATGCERADMHLVKHLAKRVYAWPVLVGPLEIERNRPRWAVDAVRGEPAARVGARFTSVNAEQVVSALRQVDREVFGIHPRHLYWAGGVLVGRPSSANRSANPANNMHLSALRGRCPQQNLNHRNPSGERLPASATASRTTRGFRVRNPRPRLRG